VTWRFVDPSPAIDDWIEREDPSEEVRNQVLSRLLTLTVDPLPPWAGQIIPGRYLADLSERPLIVGMYGLDFDERLIYLKTIDMLDDD